MTRVLPALLCAVVLPLAGCGGSSGGSPGGSSSGGGGPKVSMEDIEFKPKSLSVKVGQKVTWTNDESVQHNVVATKGASFKSELFGKGGTYSYTPKKAGSIAYVCTVHPGMEGKLTVK